MTLPPLPLVDGYLFIDNSGWLESMQTCYRYLEYKSLHRRIQAGEKAAINFGSAIHLALEHRYKKYKNAFLPDEYYGEVALMFQEFFEQHPAPADDFRTLNWAIEVIRRHNDRYDNEEFNLLQNDKQEPLVEVSFALPLFTWEGILPYTGPDGYLYKAPVIIPIIYTGKIDLPINQDGQIFVLDHKTTSMLGSQFFERMKMSSQQRGYVWALEQVLKQPVAGYIVNAIRTKQPPLYVQRGERQGANTPEKWWQESLQRERFHCSKQSIIEWKQNTIALVEEFFYNYQRGYMPMKTVQCTNFGRCPYYDVCTLVPEDRGVMLASNLYQSNDWNPLKEPTQPKAT